MGKILFISCSRSSFYKSFRKITTKCKIKTVGEIFHVSDSTLNNIEDFQDGKRVRKSALKTPADGLNHEKQLNPQLEPNKLVDSFKIH